MSALSSNVAVLYVDARGPYPALVEHWYDETRDAKRYKGPWPVVAHPPCGPWGPLRHLNEKQDPSCGPHAVEMVRRWGGVVEHPKGSTLWEHCGLPRPGALPDAWGGVTYEVAQVDWGHVARKRTWIYVVGATSIPSNPPPRDPTHWCSGFRTSKGRTPKHYRQNGSAVPPGIKVASAEQRRRTPVDFARFLISIASSCRPPVKAKKRATVVKATRPSRSRAQVTVTVAVDGKETDRETYKIKRWAVDYVTYAVLVQVADPDYESAKSCTEEADKQPAVRGGA